MLLRSTLYYQSPVQLHIFENTLHPVLEATQKPFNHDNRLHMQKVKHSKLDCSARNAVKLPEKKKPNFKQFFLTAVPKLL